MSQRLSYLNARVVSKNLMMAEINLKGKKQNRNKDKNLMMACRLNGSSSKLSQLLNPTA
jgi:hypothetical protein